MMRATIMPKIVLATLNARYHHCAFGLRYLLANLGPLRDQAELIEFTITQPTLEVLDSILSRKPRIVGLGVYIWNVDETTRLVADLKRVAPDVIVVLGGPEVSYEVDQQDLVNLADYVITGEADLEFPRLCQQLLEGAMEPRVIAAAVPDLNQLVLPYDLYADEDIAHRVIYVEASRGCPFTCEFCLSALDIPVRQFPLAPFLDSLQRLMDRGARQFKFVDRTFNLNLRVSRAILEFFLDRYQPGLFLHFELIPDRLPEALKEIIARFPPGSMQFEVGIQTFNKDVSDLISRRQENELVDQNLQWLRARSAVHVHADLIVGLPGESLESFANGFDRLVHLAPHEIQVGILKRLRGTPIIRHDQAWQMVYSPHPPYEILQTRLVDFATIQELRRFAKYWDLVANSGNFVESAPLLWASSTNQQDVAALSEQTLSPFAEFRRFCRWLYASEGQSHGIALGRLVELLFDYLTREKSLSPVTVAATLWADYQRGGRSDKPACLRPFLQETADVRQPHSGGAAGPKRQARRAAVAQEKQAIDIAIDRL